MSRDAFCPITHQFIKWGKITRAGFTLPPKCRKEIVLSPVAIFASPLKISISGWALFALMTPEQLLQAAERFSDTGGWRDMLQKRERVNKECIDVCECSSTPRSNQRTGLTMAHGVGTDQWGSWESRGMWEASWLFSLVDGDNGCAPRKLFLILSVVGVQSNILRRLAGDSPVSPVGTMEPPACWKGTTSSPNWTQNTCPLNTLNQVTYKHVKEPHT